MPRLGQEIVSSAGHEGKREAPNSSNDDLSSVEEWDAPARVLDPKGHLRALEISGLLSKELIDTLDKAIRTQMMNDKTTLYVLRQEHNSSSIFAGVNQHARQCHSYLIPSSSYVARTYDRPSKHHGLADQVAKKL